MAQVIRLYEEEILAHNLYVALGRIHPEVMPLQNIPHSEMRHLEAMAAVLKAEGIELPEPAAGHRFVTEGLDETFAKWLAEGVKSAADACRVGVRLEDHDITDLRKAQADFPKHKEVFGQLEAASNNHLRAFHRNFTSRGGDYTPEALSDAGMKKSSLALTVVAELAMPHSPPRKVAPARVLQTMVQLPETTGVTVKPALAAGGEAARTLSCGRFRPCPGVVGGIGVAALHAGGLANPHIRAAPMLAIVLGSPSIFCRWPISGNSRSTNSPACRCGRCSRF